jgi:hypothetical protein
MPLILKHPNSNANYGAPKDWNAERDGECMTVPVIQTGAIIVMHIGFDPNELAALSSGGSLQLAFIGLDRLPVMNFRITEEGWPNQRYDEQGDVIEQDDTVCVDRSLLQAAVNEIKEWKVDKDGDDQVYLNLKAILKRNYALQT